MSIEPQELWEKLRMQVQSWELKQNFSIFFQWEVLSWQNGPTIKNLLLCEKLIEDPIERSLVENLMQAFSSFLIIFNNLKIKHKIFKMAEIGGTSKDGARGDRELAGVIPFSQGLDTTVSMMPS